MQQINLEKDNIIEATVISNAKADGIFEISSNKYKIKTTKKPVDGKANKDIINLFKKKGYDVEILKGLKSSKKLLKIKDVYK